MLKSKILAAAIALLIAGSCFADEGIYGGFGGVIGMGLFSDSSKLNDKLSAAGYTKISDYSFGIGGGGGGIFKNVYVGGWGVGFPSQKVDNGRNVLSYSSGMGFFDVGLLVFSTENFCLIPKIGFGGYGKTIQVSASAITNVSFDNILQNPANTTSITFGNIAFEASILSMFKLGMANFGLSAGYIFSPKPSWTVSSVNETSVLGQPETSEHSFYLSLGVYFGSFANGLKQSIKELDSGDNESK
jgi:hypothetical protein